MYRCVTVVDKIVRQQQSTENKKKPLFCKTKIWIRPLRDSRRCLKRCEDGGIGSDFKFRSDCH